MEVEALGPAQAGRTFLLAGASRGAGDRDVRFGWAVLTPDAGGVADGVTAPPESLFDGGSSLSQLDGEGGVAMMRTHGDDLSKGCRGRRQVPAKGVPARACLAFLDRTEEGDREMQIVGMEASKPTWR